MPFHLATEPGSPGRDNEDFVAVTADGAVLLDGASAPLDTDIGCVHGVAWFTRRLGGLLLAGIVGDRPLREVLAEAVTTVSGLHRDTCDLSAQETPSATVIMVRFRGTHLEHLVLSDSVLLLEHTDGSVRPLTDTRLDDLRADLARRGRPPSAIRAYRNVPGGFWTAGADPRAADEALVGALPLAELRGWAALTDGATRGVEIFGSQTWESCYALGVDAGPAAIIEHVRELESGDPEQLRHPRGKDRDDATALLWTRT